VRTCVHGRAVWVVLSVATWWRGVERDMQMTVHYSCAILHRTARGEMRHHSTPTEQADVTAEVPNVMNLMKGLERGACRVGLRVVTTTRNMHTHSKEALHDVIVRQSQNRKCRFFFFTSPRPSHGQVCR
jgi:hypothetical protein